MQISDLVGQYSRNVSQDVSVAAPAPGVQQLLDAVGEMTVGSIFEGTVNSIHRGEVVLGLGNGQTVAARLAGNISLSKGQSMFFQVKSNNGTQVEIRPYTKGNLSNPILLKALDAAGIPANERTVSMVNTMMEEQLPVDKQSLMEMARVVASNAGIDVETIVQMKKLGIPVTEELANQFVNYKQDHAAITEQMENLFEQLPDIFKGNDLTTNQMLEISGQIVQMFSEEETVVTTAESAQQPVETTDPAVEVQQAPSEEETAQQPAEQSALEGEMPEEQQAVRARWDYPEGTAGRVLTEEQAQQFERQLGQLFEPEEQGGLFSDGKPNLDLSSKKVLLELQTALQHIEPEKETAVKNLLSGEPYQRLLREALEDEWLMRPKDVESKDKIKGLYERLERQMTQLEHVMEQTGMDKSQLAKAASDIRNNVDFMNQINQAYTYLQLPLKLSGQNAHSDLYVYTNKKNLADPDGELTAFLHLDMDHLGSTDVSIQMRGKKVHTDFFLADDKSYNLILEHLDLLEERLLQKGYSCTIQVQNKEKKVDFVEDFLKKDQPSTGRLHRYSFDVRA